ncbi:hypothetical protein [Streptomyces sp. Ac-502]|uniref:hypothetical protein n=1 Tax=Streptomyces sp. Ac-502 TaxID=3342801 RepID=UPI0038623873
MTTPWRAAVAVADVDGLHFPDGTTEPLPPLEELHSGRFAALVHELGLGHGGKRGSGPSASRRPSDGQIYITAALAEALDLPIPEDGPDTERRAFLAARTDHPFLARARAEGWTVARWGTPLRIYREQETGRALSAQLVIVPHHAPFGDRFLDDDPAPALLARRVQQLADTVGITYRRSAAATGHALLEATRPKNGRRADPLERAELPATVLTKGRQLYVAKNWDRQPTPEERKRRYVLAYDTRASYLAPCGSLAVGRGDCEHRTGEVEFDPKVPGLWLAKRPGFEHSRTFDPFGPEQRPGVPAAGDERRWYYTPTLAYADKDLKADIKVYEALVWPDHYRMLEPWYTQLSTARKGITPGTEQCVSATVKDVYTHSIGLFNSDLLLGAPGVKPEEMDPKDLPLTFRPDVQQSILAAQQANLTRTITRVGETCGLWPIAVKTDCLFYVVDDPCFETAVPGLKLESAGGPGQPMTLGSYKPEGAALAEDVFAHLKPGKRWFPKASAFTAPEDWSV